MLRRMTMTACAIGLVMFVAAATVAAKPAKEDAVKRGEYHQKSYVLGSLHRGDLQGYEL
jgi:hypothetical protein